MAGILLIDDDYRIRNPVKTIFRRLTSHEVTDTAEGRFGIAQAAANMPDLILLNIELPDMDGYEVCRHLKANPDTREIPVIMLSSHGAAHDVARAYQSGANDYIVKLFTSAILLAKVTNHLKAADASLQQLAPATDMPAAITSAGPSQYAAWPGQLTTANWPLWIKVN